MSRNQGGMEDYGKVKIDTYVISPLASEKEKYAHANWVWVAAVGTWGSVRQAPVPDLDGRGKNAWGRSSYLTDLFSQPNKVILSALQVMRRRRSVPRDGLTREVQGRSTSSGSRSVFWRVSRKGTNSKDAWRPRTCYRVWKRGSAVRTVWSPVLQSRPLSHQCATDWRRAGWKRKKT